MQAQIINLLKDLQQELGVAYLFVAHDLAVVEHISHRILVMYLGRIVETGPAREIVQRPRHPYTQSLLAAVPRTDRPAGEIRPRLVGDPPSALTPPSGCRFHTRCPHVMPVCREVAPTLKPAAESHLVSCHLTEDVR